MTTPARLPTFFISHGGGPWPWMKEMTRGAYDGLERALGAMPALFGARPRAILMLSAHWEEPAFTVQAHPAPGMIYDYGGFPEHTYHIHYRAPGDPALAERVHTLLTAAGLPAAVDAERGFDHGMFSPMAAIYPAADMPTVQLSLRRGLDPAEHLALGRALAPLRDEGIVIVGSGLSYHNLRNFGPAAQAPSAAFDGWLHQVLPTPGPARDAALVAWAQAPAARQAHPREEHLLPLMVAVGAAESEAGSRIYHEANFMGGISVSSFMFGQTPA
ncbi:DODA-type extradiol aromatic ring-opening family dioxygenase [Pseudorhodoferax sp.]|uniref:DODA-type extradiol aromatic ring-opening family dioxygenase n=1 Tax=Pseudorhodoferax sp. TaxID=1993553 RepID=UPI002DD658D1|nr:class III extradiol ring-cleavage dioxygenase [Pseudorhodoferax sp.]